MTTDCIHAIIIMYSIIILSIETGRSMWFKLKAESLNTLPTLWGGLSVGSCTSSVPHKSQPIPSAVGINLRRCVPLSNLVGHGSSIYL